MGFNIKRPYGYREMWTQITDKIISAVDGVKDWCNQTFSLNTHNHDDKYDSKGSSSLVQSNLNVHDNNTTKHITATERNTWNSKANASHTHTQSQISGLTSALAGKASTSHTHTASSIGAVGFPNWSARTRIYTGHIVLQNGWILIDGHFNDSLDGAVYLNGIMLSYSVQYGTAWETWDFNMVPVRSGDHIVITGDYVVLFMPFL